MAYTLVYVIFLENQIVSSVLTTGPTEVTVQRCCKFQVLTKNH